MEVVEREHDAAGSRHPLDAVVAERRQQPDEGADRVPADRPDGVGARHAGLLREDDLLDPGNDLVDGEVGRVDLDRVLGRAHVDRVLLVAEPEVGGERVGADPRPLGGAPRGADALVRDEVDLHLCLGRDDRADVAALDHDVALAPERALPLAHHLAHVVVARDDGDELVDVRLADRGRDVAAVDEDAALLVEPDRVLGRERGQLAGEVECHAAAARQPGQRAVHRPRVEVAEAEPLGEKPCDRALAGPCGPIDGDDHQEVVALSESSRS